MFIEKLLLFFRKAMNDRWLADEYLLPTSTHSCVLGLIDSTAAAVVEYRYDAWGKLLAITGSMADTLGKYNPFRYRGYIYDDETGLYWLTSRYYNPEWKRFINVDRLLGNTGALISHNLYCYCFNNPIFFFDFNGSYPQSHFHNMVCKAISDNSNGSIIYQGTRITYIGGRIGFADLIDPAAWKVWEVKRVTHSAPKALRQLARYIGKGGQYHWSYAEGIWEKITLSKGENRPVLNGCILDENFFLMYGYAAEGIVLYDYVYLNNVTSEEEAKQRTTSRMGKASRRYASAQAITALAAALAVPIPFIFSCSGANSYQTQAFY